MSSRTSASGPGQLSLVEHASVRWMRGPPCSRVSGTKPYSISRMPSDSITAQVEVSCTQGLSAHDEFYLWGLLALTLAQPNPETEFHATPHYCLRQLGLVDANARRGGRQYQQFAAAIERLSWVKYGCDAFYDPIRAEHCQVRFSFFSYRLPADPASSRAWRFHWDGQFFEFVKAVGGSLQFDLELYRDSVLRRGVYSCSFLKSLPAPRTRHAWICGIWRLMCSGYLELCRPSTCWG